MIDLQQIPPLLGETPNFDTNLFAETLRSMTREARRHSSEAPAELLSEAPGRALPRDVLSSGRLVSRLASKNIPSLLGKTPNLDTRISLPRRSELYCENLFAETLRITTREA